jgi:hypothetical protein
MSDETRDLIRRATADPVGFSMDLRADPRFAVFPGNPAYWCVDCRSDQVPGAARRGPPGCPGGEPEGRAVAGRARKRG